MPALLETRADEPDWSLAQSWAAYFHHSVKQQSAMILLRDRPAVARRGRGGQGA